MTNLTSSLDNIGVQELDVFSCALDGVNQIEASAGTGVSASTTSRGDYYAGIEDRSVDATATGAIASSGAKAFGRTDENKQ